MSASELLDPLAELFILLVDFGLPIVEKSTLLTRFVDQYHTFNRSCVIAYKSNLVHGFAVVTNNYVLNMNLPFDTFLP